VNEIDLNGRKVPVGDAMTLFANACQARNVGDAELLARALVAARPRDVDMVNDLAGAAFGTGLHGLAASLMQHAMNVEPQNPVFVRNLGLVLEVMQRRAEAISLFTRAAEMKPDYADAHASLGAALLAQDRLDEAIAALRRATIAQPAHLGAALELAQALERNGDVAAARAEYERLLALDPRQLDALNNLGALLDKTNDVDGALHVFERAVAVAPGVAILQMNLGNVLRRKGRLTEAAERLRLAVSLDPNRADAYGVLGSVLAKLERNDDAIAAYTRALALQPASTEALVGLAGVHEAVGNENLTLDYLRRALEIARGERNAAKICGISKSLGILYQQKIHDVARAEEAFREAIDADPRSADALAFLATLFVERGRTAEALSLCDKALALDADCAHAWHCRGRAAAVQGELAEAARCYRRSLSIDPTNSWWHTNLLLCLNYDAAVDEAVIVEEHRAWDAKYASKARADVRPHTNTRDPEKRLRIGFVSCDLNRHPVGYIFSATMPYFDKKKFEIVCYSNSNEEDDLTAQLKSHADRWRYTASLKDAALVEQIRQDEIDILVELTGHAGIHRLLAFAAKPAPVQVSWLGYFATTGLSTMDYVLLDDAVAPEGAERLFVEKIVRLPNSRFVYAPPSYAPEPAAPPITRNGYPTFGSFNNVAKITPDVVRLWSRILAAVPDAKLLVKWGTLGEEVHRQRYQRLFEEHGLDPRRFELRAGTPHAQMLVEYGDVDVALDPFPFSGGLTSLEALWMGIPIVTMPGVRTVSRQTHGFLKLVGLEHLSCRGPDEYVERAVQLTRDVDALVELRRNLRGVMARSPLCDGAMFARNLESAYRDMWREFCSTHARSS
jgi:predicted O-linked N-acetylglucosamine transferase (SPINDLY family)